MLREATFSIRLVVFLLMKTDVDPDVGVDEDIAQFYFMQLISAMVCFSISWLISSNSAITRE